MNVAYIANIGKANSHQEDSLIIGANDMSENIKIQDSIKNAVCINNIDLSFVAVSDGIAGLRYGEIASMCTLDYFSQIQNEEHNAGINKILRKTQHKLSTFALEKPKYHGMGATIAGVRFFKNEIEIFNAGDSRVYIYSNSKLTQLSTDHTLARKMMLKGELRSSEDCADAYKMLDSAIIASDDADDFEIASTKLTINPDDKILICTDGLSDMIEHKTIEKYFAKYQNIQELTDKLFNKAMRNGGKDNLTLIVIAH